MAPVAHVLIVEDEEKIAQILVEFFALEGFETKVIASGDKVIDAVMQQPPLAIILDRMLPGVDGLTLCKQIRRFSQVPILLLTARVDEIDRLIGLEAGADDYVCKPFSPREVVARVQTILRRVTQQPNELDKGNILTFEHIQMDIDKFHCTCHDIAVDLTPVEFRLLATIMSKPGVVYSREQLMSSGYQDGRVVSNRTIDSHMKNLRHKLTVKGYQCPIQAVYGVGYKLAPSQPSSKPL